MCVSPRKGQSEGMNETNTNGSVRQLRRTRNGRVVSGVCSGIGEYIGVDPNILRVALAVATFFGGLGVGIYAVAWLLVPEEGREESIVQDLMFKNKDNKVWQDAKSKWDKGWEAGTRNWNQQAPASYDPPAGYSQHPYGRPTATSAPETSDDEAVQTPPAPRAPENPPAPPQA
jgi:phage shock protein PspC (stress-responsive transcriptional regulator)